MSYFDNKLRLVLDTDVVVSAMRSSSGASASLLLSALEGVVTPIINVALVLEYEAVCLRRQHLEASGLNESQAVNFIDSIVAISEVAQSHFNWRPQLIDAQDELVLDAAINGGARMIVTFNSRHFGAAERFGIGVFSPRQAIRRIRS
jgi:putative PIN family toxin of toxin-antitoxin system